MKKKETKKITYENMLDTLDYLESNQIEIIDLINEHT